MKNIYLLSVVGLLLINLISQPIYGQKKDCGESCFHSEIVELLPDGDCATYKVKITAGGNCVHGLSHYSVAIPECFELTHVSNSENWKIEYGTDPTTGIIGFKIDNINGFGDDKEANEFYVTFTVCTVDCEESLGCWAPEVAYKAGTCVYYEESELVCANLDAHLVKTDAICANEASGSLEVVIDDGVSPYIYLWSNGSTEAVATNLVAGVYSVVITDANNTTLELSEEILAPLAIDISTEITNASCSGLKDGAVAIAVSGGTAPYTYLWSNGETSQDIEGLSSGYYLLKVTDANGCTVSKSAIVNNNISISITGVVTNAGCGLDIGAIDISVNGGTAPYTYFWTGGSEEEDLSDLSPGTYRVTVTDANGCFAARTFGVNRDNPLRLSAETTPTACVENNSGAIDLGVLGGAEPYTYEWSNGATTEDLEGLSLGSYTVTVTDQNGCFASMVVNIVAESFQASSMVSQISCNGASDGSIQLIVSGGTAPYTYTWSNGVDGDELSGLEPGQYSVVITDGAGCTKTLYYSIVEPTPINLTFAITNPTCEDTDYQVDLIVTGGSGPYVFNWSDGQTIEDLLGLIAGTYNVTVTDSNGCTMEGQVIVTAEEANCTNDDGDDDGGTGDDDGGTGDDGGGTGDGGDGGTDDGGGSDHGGNGNGHDWDLNCYNPFDTSLELVAIEGNCYTYTATVTYDGEHVHGLSHLSVAVDCGDIDGVTNSEHWRIEYGKDPTTELVGFKIDDINGFGEGSLADQFDFTFTICSEDEQCTDLLGDADFEMAYKYGQCITYQDVDGTADLSDQMSVVTYPNPSTGLAKIKVYTPQSTHVTVDIYNRQGLLVKKIYNDFVSGGQNAEFLFEGYNLPSDIYTYKITTDYGVKYGKLILTKHL